MGHDTVIFLFNFRPIRNKSLLTLSHCLLFCILLPIFSPGTIGQTVYTVRSIEFEGNHALSTNQLAAGLLTLRNGALSETILAGDGQRILDLYKDHAYLHARLDSTKVARDTILQEADIKFYITEGKPSILRQIEFDGCKNLSPSDLYSIMQLHEGNPFIPDMLEQDIKNMLKQYENKGYALSKIKIQNISFIDTASEMSVIVRLHINEGKAIHISELRIEGNKSTRDYVILREARLDENELYSNDLPERIKRRLDHLQLFSSVSMPELYLTDSQKAGLLVKVVEGNQNNFDGMLGYVPASSGDGTGYITGLVNISLRNLFGTGRKFSIRWFQENKSSQETELHYFEPWIASYPVNAQLGFFQRKQDSTYVRLQFDIAAELMITEELSAGISFLQNNVYPTERSDKSKVIAESKTTSWGVSIRYDSRDNPVTPASGILYSTNYETGTKQTAASEAFPLTVKSTTQRILFDLSYYISPFLRQVIAAELHLRDFSSGNIDVSDLFRLGGATTLRGYTEGQFLGTRLLWTNLEYRFIVAPLSYFYGFLDFGYIAPFSNELGLRVIEQSKTGYGIGVRMDSALGLIGVSIALGEGDTFSRAKIHFRLVNEF